MTNSVPRERLDRDVATELYIRTGEVETFLQAKRDALDLDRTLTSASSRPLGPFARIRADAVVNALGKTRGAINNVWRSQEAFQSAVMAFSLDASAQDGLGTTGVTYPDPADCADLASWIAELAVVEINRGPRHGMEPEACYSLRWAMWLGLLPYGLWSESIASESIAEYHLGIQKYQDAVLAPALDHFKLTLADDVTLTDLSVSVASTVEGFWLNACCSDRDPAGRDQEITSSLVAVLRILIRGATRPRRGRST